MNFKRKKIYVSMPRLDFNSLVLFIKIKIKKLSIINLPRFNKFFMVDIADSHVIHYGTPTSLTYAWSFGFLAGICLIIQMLSGIFLSMHYVPNTHLAFLNNYI